MGKTRRLIKANAENPNAMMGLVTSENVRDMTMKPEKLESSFG